MIVLFVRHADAVERASSHGDDMARPLTGEGRKKAAAAAAYLRRIYRTAQRILASPAVRAQETAAALATAFGLEVETTPLLSPGSIFSDYAELISAAWDPEATVILVGHEPDLSSMISEAAAGGGLRIKAGKISCVELDVKKNGRGVLRKLLPFSVMSQ